MFKKYALARRKSINLTCEDKIRQTFIRILFHPAQKMEGSSFLNLSLENLNLGSENSNHTIFVKLRRQSIKKIG